MFETDCVGEKVGRDTDQVDRLRPQSCMVHIEQRKLRSGGVPDLRRAAAAKIKFILL